MFFQFVWNELKESKLISLIFVLFVSLSIALTSVAVILAVNLGQAIDYQMALAKAPHFMQMHMGEIDEVALEKFAADNPLVESYQSLEFLNMDNSSLQIAGRSMQDSLQDNALSVQSKHFDFLLDLDNNIIEPKQGEVYLPLMFLGAGIELGDTMLVDGYELKIAGFLRDAQMNSPLSSSKRFIVHASDFDNLRTLGSMEYLIEFNLHNLGDLTAFEQEFLALEMDFNGPTITYPLLKLINALSDGILIATLLLGSFVLVFLSFLCIRFTLLSKLEGAYREIGILRAIGIEDGEIKRLYLGQYLVICVLAIGLGLTFALLGARGLLEPIRMNTGLLMPVPQQFFIGLLIAIIIVLIILLFVYRVLNHVKKISPIEAIRHDGTRQERSKKHKPSRIMHLLRGPGRLAHVDQKLAWKGMGAKKKLYATLLLLFVLLVFFMVLPSNIYSTLQDESFVSYMGTGNADLTINMRETSHEAPEALLEHLAQDDAVESYVYYETQRIPSILPNDVKVELRVNVGDHSQFPPKYLEGNYPSAPNEIALSYLSADELQVAIGDTLNLEIGEQLQPFTVSGIYSDITHGGKSAKITNLAPGLEIIGQSMVLKLVENADAERTLDSYTAAFSEAKVSSIARYRDESFGPVTRSLRLGAIIAGAVAVFIFILIVFLFTRLLLIQDSRDIAVEYALGFTKQDVFKQYLLRIGLVLVTGLGLGILLSQVLGQTLASMMFSSFGIMRLDFVIRPLTVYVLYLAIIVLAIWLSTWLSMRYLKRIRISEFI